MHLLGIFVATALALAGWSSAQEGTDVPCASLGECHNMILHFDRGDCISGCMMHEKFIYYNSGRIKHDIYLNDVYSSTVQ